tara:strand:+ start:1007 stop:1432 length:426 start_codon:yes stop_codon:yes gene_type:complete
MINGIRLNQKNISPNQRRIRLQEIAGLKISNRDKKILKPRDCECIKEVVSMVQIPMNRKQNVPNKLQSKPEDLVDLEEVLREMGYGDTDDLRANPTDEMEEDDEVGSMSRDELKQMIEDIVFATLEEQDDLNEIIESLTTR